MRTIQYLAKFDVAKLETTVNIDVQHEFVSGEKCECGRGLQGLDKDSKEW